MTTPLELQLQALQRKALAVIARQKAAIEPIETELSIHLPAWRDRTIRMLSGLVVEEELQIFGKINTDNWGKDKVAFKSFLVELEKAIQDLPDQFLVQDVLLTAPATPAQGNTSTTAQIPVSSSVFIVHGHDSLAKIELARTLEKLKLNAIVLHEQPNEGKTIIEKFERDASKVSFAVVLLTPDDCGYPKGKPDEARPRARQNVVLELGFFSGALGRSNVCVLYKGDVEVPSDYLGVVYVQMDDGGAWKFALAKELRQANLPVDLNNLV